MSVAARLLGVVKGIEKSLVDFYLRRSQLQLETRSRVVASVHLFLCLIVVFFGSPMSTALAEFRFAIPNHIVVDIAPFASIEEALAARYSLDWQSEPDRAQAVTLAFAAKELQGHLKEIGVVTKISSENAPSGQKQIKLVVEPANSDLVQVSEIDAQAFAITPYSEGITIKSTNRIGVLYGVYRLLDHMGFAWQDPLEILTPDIDDTTKVSWIAIAEKPRILLRGYWTGRLDPSLPDTFALWMARNRLNLGGSFNPVMQGLLGHKSWVGDHELVQEVFSAPGLFETHPNWFSEINGERRKIVAGEDAFNPAFAEPAAASYMAEQLIKKLNSGDMQHVDIVNIWPTDTRFSNFDQSSLGQQTGNESDNLLVFTMRIADELRLAFEQRRINRLVKVAGISYLVTMQPPSDMSRATGPEIQNYIQLIYPIDRDWTALAGDSLNNPRLKSAIETWQRAKETRNGVVDYYNMSAFGGLALTNLTNLGADFAITAGSNTDLTAWMHPIATNPGPRLIIDSVLSKLAWQENTQGGTLSTAELKLRAEEITKRFFEQRYGPNAKEWHGVSLSVASALENTNQMFGIDALMWVVLQDQIWADPFYNVDERIELARGFIEGGLQAQPVRFSGKPETKATFMGLKESTKILEGALKKARRFVLATGDSKIRERMKSDLIWFETSLLRQRLLLRSAEHLVGLATKESIAAGLADADALLASPVLKSTFMTVDQKDGIEMNKKYLLSARLQPGEMTFWQRITKSIKNWF